MPGAHPILVVDDSPDLLEAYKEILGLAGYEVVAVLSGREALSVLERWRPEVLLTDISMPEMDGFELIERMRDALKEAAPVAVVCSAFAITEQEAMRRGARLFLAKPVSAPVLLDGLARVLDGQLPDAAQLQAERGRVNTTRLDVRDTGRRRLDVVGRDHEAALARPWLDWLKTYFACAWSAVFLLDDHQVLELLAKSVGPKDDLPRGQPLRASLEEVVETGSSLIVADARQNPSFRHQADGGQEVRFFAAVPLLTPDDVAVGAIGLADPAARRFDAESVVILEQLGRRGALLLGSGSAGTRSARGHAAPLLAQSTFETLVSMELRIGCRRAEALELATLELATDDAFQRCADLLWEVAAGPRVGIGALGPRRVGICQRGPAADIRRRIGAGIEAVRDQGLVNAVGVVSATCETGLSPPGLFRIADQALRSGRSTESPFHLGRIVIGPA